MIIITGAAGFIGSALIAYLNEQGIMNAVPVDDFSTPVRLRNLAWKHHSPPVDKSRLSDFLKSNAGAIEAVIHLGGKAGYIHDNWEQQQADFMENGKALWRFCTEHQIPLLFASSGAVYEGGEHGFKDDTETSLRLKPAHPYTQMRLTFDNWALEQKDTPPFWAALRMFNVYGPNEYHKSQNASMIFKAYNEIISDGNLTLFASHRPEIPNGGMKRDFIYVKDVTAMIFHLLKNGRSSGIYNLGTGESRSFLEIGTAVFHELGMAPDIRFAAMPENLREIFPYFSKADISKLRATGCQKPVLSAEDGIKDYVQKYLIRGEFY